MKRKTHEEFFKQMELINPNIKIVGRYINDKTKIRVKCVVCGKEWSPVPNSLIRGCGCPRCVGREKTHDEFVEEIKNINPNIEIIGKYIKSKTKIKCVCKVCDKEWEVTPNSLLRGSGCPECSKITVANSHRKTHEEFLKETKSLHPSIKIVGKYIDIRTKIRCECLLCGNIWNAIPDNLLHGEGCPKCKLSKGELKIEKFLQDNNIYYIPQKKFDDLLGVGGRKLSYDFYIPHNNTLIEFNGAQHKVPVKYFGGEDKFITQLEHDKRKREFAAKHKYTLMEIFYDDFDKIESILYNELIS